MLLCRGSASARRCAQFLSRYFLSIAPYVRLTLILCCKVPLRDMVVAGLPGGTAGERGGKHGRSCERYQIFHSIVLNPSPVNSVSLPCRVMLPNVTPAVPQAIRASPSVPPAILHTRITHCRVSLSWRCFYNLRYPSHPP